MRDRLCVVMPVYNEEAAIGPVLGKWDDALAALGIDYEIRPYNDGSKDGSLDVMREIAAGRPRISVRNKENGGHGNTILTGYREAAADGFDWVFQIDSDDEMGPEKFGELWNRRGEFDFGVGIRDGRKQALPRKIVSFISRLCVRLFYGRSVWDVNTPYRLMRVSAFRDFFMNIPLSTFAPNVILSGLAGAAGLKRFEMRVPQHDRTTGEVSIKKWKLLKAAARSFMQTIAFSFGKTATDAMGGWRARILGVLSAAACLSGMAFVMITISKSIYLAATAAVMCAMLAARRSHRLRSLTGKTLEWADRHSWTLLAGVLLTGFAMRMIMYAFNTNLSLFLAGDCAYFWNCAKAMASGAFPEFKSWTVPGLYALSIKVFGESLMAAACLNIVLQALTAVVLFAFARMAFGRDSAGVVAAAGFFLSPYFSHFVFKIYGEHLYFLVVSIEMLLLCVWQRRKSLWAAVAIPVVAVLALYTRSEAGMLLLILSAGLYLCNMLGGRRSFTTSAVALVALLAVAGCGLMTGSLINQRFHGTSYALCSPDGWWPRLYGSNVSSVGRNGVWVKTAEGKRVFRNCGDKQRILRRCEAATGVKIKLRPGECPAELIPYIRDEISRRWKAMSSWQMMKFVVAKERHVFARVNKINRPDVPCVNAPTANLAQGVDGTLKVVLSAAALLLLWGTLRRTAIERPLKASERTMPGLFSLAPMLYCIGVACVVAVAEANGRYGLVWSAFLPVYAGGWLCANAMLQGRTSNPESKMRAPVTTMEE